MPFKKGNPGGGRRPATNQWKLLKSLCYDNAEEAFRILLDLMRNGKQERTRLAAVRELFDRGFGKPVQAVDVATTTSKSEIQELPREDRIAVLRAALAAEESASEKAEILIQ